MWKQLRSLLLVGTLVPFSIGIVIGVAHPVIAEDGAELNSEDSSSLPVPRLAELDQHATTIEEWLAQLATPVEVMGVSVNSTETGLEVLLETVEEQLESPATSVVGNALIADIPNAVLVLPEGNEFQQANPIEGIALVSVTSLPDNRVRVAITGVDAPPTADLSVEASGLVLAVTPGTEVVETDEDAIEIVVTATRTEEEVQNVPRSVTVINRQQLQQQSTITNNLGDILGNLVPGFGPPNQADRFNAQSLRGREPAILIDGVPLQDRVSFNIQLRSIDPDAIERVEIVRGPSATYGQGAAGGIINIITRRPDDEPLSSTLSLGTSADLGLQGDSFAYDLGYTLSINEGKFDLLATFSGNINNQFYDAEGDRIAPSNTTLDDRNSFNVLGKLGLNFTEDQRLQLTVNHLNESRELEYISDPAVDETPETEKARALFIGEQEFIGSNNPGQRNTVVNLNYSNRNLLGSQFQLQAYYQELAGYSIAFDFRPDAIEQNFQRSQQWGGRLQFDTPISENASLLWGADYVNENDNTFARVSFDIDDYVNSGFRILRAIDEANDVPPYDYNSLGLFAQLQWNISQRWSLNGGARYEISKFLVDDYISADGEPVEGGEVEFDDPVFNIGAIYNVSDAVSLFANFAQGFAAPDIFDALETTGPLLGSFEAGVEDIRAQKFDSYEIGVRGNWEQIQFSLAAFYNYSDLAGFLTAAPRGGVITRAPIRNYGVEATLDWQPVDNWQLGGIFSWTEGEFQDDEEDEFLPRSSFLVQPLKLGAYVDNQTTPGWRNRLQLLVVGSRDRAFEEDVDAVPIESYVTLDYISSINLGAGTLNIGIENLLNNQYQPVFQQLLSGFNDTSNIAAPGRRLSIRYSFTW
ncbi:TonB-dependent receptor [Gloeocapsopsis sp. IPPAS B-1203]|uniref:TonB-dependent receptor domain-containing protein n=1 Tax=Gloeocapsopsis sp. IPPAS B-1203 TaxID=2049454 RepID=UPI000C17B06A|nr:TonB-dependent receptor [Gloeocapsopsis sp. IPPAS B-1203]PIG93510.1 TonB-dependent receptor [Gloeocapsopsis sp. IPPAS B-1203]